MCTHAFFCWEPLKREKKCMRKGKSLRGCEWIAFNGSTKTQVPPRSFSLSTPALQFNSIQSAPLHLKQNKLKWKKCSIDTIGTFLSADRQKRQRRGTDWELLPKLPSASYCLLHYYVLTPSSSRLLLSALLWIKTDMNNISKSQRHHHHHHHHHRQIVIMVHVMSMTQAFPLPR